MRRPTPLLLLPILLLAGLSVLLSACGGGGGSSSSTHSSPASDAGAPTTGPIPPSRPLKGTVADPAAAPWPQFGRTADRSGGAPVLGPQSDAVRWRRQLEGPAVPGPAVGRDGIVYAASNGGVLHAIDLRTGRDVWSFDGGGSYGIDLSTVPALLEDGTVLWPGPQNTVFALSPAGKLLWKEVLPAQPLSPAVAADGTVLLGDTGGTLEELTTHGAAHPTQDWRIALGGPSFGSPALAADGTAYTTTGSSLVAVRDGKEQWRFSGKTESEVSPAVAPDGTVIFGTNDSEYGVSPAGKELWRHPNGTRTYSSPVVTHDGIVYYGDNHGRLTALRADTGELVARYVGLERPPGVWTAPAVDAHHDVYFGTQNGHVYGFAASGKQLFDLDAGAGVDSYPALAADGTLLIGAEDGTLYALR
jgi:outer membrane protein assembly factor BamB